MNTQIVGLISGLLIVFFSIAHTNDNKVIFLNTISILIVVGGTFAASTLTFGLKELNRIFIIIQKIFFRKTPEFKDSITQILTISEHLNKGNKVSTLNNADFHPFIADGIRLIENDLEYEEIKSIMEISVIERKNAFIHQIEIVRTMAKYPPVFGMIGTVIGLVAVLQGLGKSTDITQIGPAMAIALITTLYGLFLANIFFVPLSDNLQHRLNYSRRLRKLIIRGILLIKEGKDTIYIQEVLNAHLLPEKRLELI